MDTNARNALGAAAGERVALVTGGTGGIGRAVALQLARGGDRVLFVGRNAERSADVLAALREARPGTDHAFLQADLSLLAETARLAEEVARRTERLDAAAFCAGILSTVPARAQRLERRNGLWAASEDLIRPYLPEAAAIDAR